MVSNYTSLNDFVYPIPICQPGADLGSILSIFQHLNCKLLAIPQNSGGWGTINAEDLLSLIAEVWLGKQTALVSHPRKIASQQNIAHVTTQDFNSLIKPAIVYQADISINEFLNHYDSIFSNKCDCLIVNRGGELQGKLDQTKIINYLAQESRESSRNVEPLPTFLAELGNLIDAIALPLKIEPTEGADIYQNKCWQRLVNDQTSVDSTVEKSNLQEMTWSHGQKRSPMLAEYGQYHDSQNRCGVTFSQIISEICCLDPSTEIALTTESVPPPPETNTLEQRQSLTDAAQDKLNEIDSSHLAIEIEQTSDWNYIKFPLIAAPGCSGFNNPYWLVLATKAVVNQPSSFSESSSSDTSELVTNKLLATVSHELKSPLTGIVGLSSLLKGQKLGQLNQRQARYVQLIYSGGQKMMGIVNDLLKLTNLAAEQLLEPELINLEFLCRQLYQQALTKVTSTATGNSDWIVAASGIQLQIELGCEIAIANKSLLSGVLSHLILETIRVSESLDDIKINISNFSGLTAIAVERNLTTPRSWSSPPESPDSLVSNSGLDLMIAEYLAEVIQGKITSTYATDCCRFTLLLPKKNLQHHQSADTSNSTSSTSRNNDHTNVTILCLYPESEATTPETNHDNSSNFSLKSWSDNNEHQGNYHHRIIEADSLEQAHTLARIWQLDVIVLDSYQIVNPDQYLRSLQESDYLAALPLITLDTKTTEAANQIEGLNVYPCLLPAKHRRFEDLMQVIQIATGA